MGRRQVVRGEEPEAWEVAGDRPRLTRVDVLGSGPHDAQRVAASANAGDAIAREACGSPEARHQPAIMLNVFDERPADSQLRAVEQARRVPPGQDERVRAIRVGYLEDEANGRAIKHRLATVAEKEPQVPLSLSLIHI